MKILLCATLFVSGSLFFADCASAKKSVSSVPSVTYVSNIQQLVVANCSPYHFPASGGKKLALDNVDTASTHIDDIIARIEKHPGEKGFMPMKRSRLSDSNINVFRQWKTDGLKTI